MPTYAVGDIQGCYRTLTKLLAAIRFDPERDRLWLVGDLVNRGPRSLEVLRWARALDRRINVVLGNHDIHLLARAYGAAGPKRKDTLEAVLQAPDREELLDWLRRRPLLHREGDFVLVHAGLLPEWTPAKAERLAREVHSALAGPRFRTLLRNAPGGLPARWREGLAGTSRVRVLANVFTRLRTCYPDGRMCLDFSGAPEAAPSGCIPWFEHASRRSAATTVIFGHWAALGFRMAPGLIALDSGCVWGGKLTAVRLDDGAVFQEPLADA